MARKKLIRFEEIKKMPNVFEAEDGLGMKGKWRSIVFKNENPLVLELGCGEGIYAQELSAAYPDKNFIGIDKKGERIWKGAKKALEAERENCVFLKILIEKLEEYFEENEVGEIWVTFPDPFPKPCKAGKRLTSERFLKLYEKILKKDGLLHLKTDHLGLFEFSLEEAEKSGFEILEEIRDVHGKSQVPELLQIKTYYEKKFMAEGKPIYYSKALFRGSSFSPQPQRQSPRNFRLYE